MKTPNTKNRGAFAIEGKKKYTYYREFKRKNAIIRYMEIGGVIAIALIVVGGMFGYFN
jgi:hypothetical protein